MMSSRLSGASTTHGSVPTIGFPGRVTSAVCMIVAPIVLCAMCLMGADIYHFYGRPLLTAMAAHPDRTETFLNVVPIAIVMLMLAVVGLAGAARAASPRLADFGGAALLLALCGPIFFVAIEFAGYQLAGPEHLAAGAYMYDQANMIPRISLNIVAPAFLAGFITLSLAAYRAGVFGRFRAICFAGTLLLPAGFISGILLFSAAGFLACTIALAPLGVALLRHPPRRAAPAYTTTDTTAIGHIPS